MGEATRQQDEMLLAYIGARAGGKTISQIGREYGRSSAALTTQTNKVMTADLEHCQEYRCASDLAEIQTAYWPRKQ